MAGVDETSNRPRRDPVSASESSLRSDAERNRDQILDAARRLYASEGLTVSMAAVAREAGVGKATLSRRFATKDELIDAVFADHMDNYIVVTDECLADPDPWRGFVNFVYRVCEMQATDRGLADVLTTSFPGATALEARRTQAYSGFVEIVERARATHHLTQDFVPADLVILLLANAGVLSATASDSSEVWRRLVDYMLRGFANPGAPLPYSPNTLTHDDIERALHTNTD